MLCRLQIIIDDMIYYFCCLYTKNCVFLETILLKEFFRYDNIYISYMVLEITLLLIVLF